MFYIFALFSAFINNRSLYESFGFRNEYPIMIGFLLFSDALTPMDAIVKLLMNILSRKFEFEAGIVPYLIPLPFALVPFSINTLNAKWLYLDAFAVKLGYTTELAQSLLKLQIQNLSTMDADWMYASYHYSHPILPERLGALGWKGKATDSKAQDSDKPIKASDREL
jgi:STE24 endopeptidase